jgi:hypothetical protein
MNAPADHIASIVPRRLWMLWRAPAMGLGQIFALVKFLALVKFGLGQILVK